MSWQLQHKEPYGTLCKRALPPSLLLKLLQGHWAERGHRAGNKNEQTQGERISGNHN